MEPSLALSMAFNICVGGIGIVVAFYALHLAIATRIECRAMKESTHAVQYVPFEPGQLDEDESADAANTRGEREDYDNLASIHEREEPLN